MYVLSGATTIDIGHRAVTVGSCLYLLLSADIARLHTT